MLRWFMRLILKIGVVAFILFAVMPLMMLLVAGSFWIFNPLQFLAPFLTVGALVLLLWTIVEVVRRLSPQQRTADQSREPTRAAFDEADVRLVLESKETVGRLRMLAEDLKTPPAAQLLGLAATADGFLRSLTQSPQALAAGRRLLAFHLQRVLAGAEHFATLPRGREHRNAADSLGNAAIQLGEALRLCRDRPDALSMRRLDAATRALTVGHRTEHETSLPA